MLIPWSVGMKSKDVWLWDPARRWRKRKQNNRPTKGWTKITQTADLRITKTENTGRKDNRNEPSLHTSDVGAFVIHRSTHRGASYSWAIYFTYRRHWKWGWDGKRCTQWRRKTDVTSLGESNPQIATVKKLSSQELLPAAQFMVSANDRHNGKQCGQQHLDDQQSPNPDKPNLCREAREEKEKRHKRYPHVWRDSVWLRHHFTSTKNVQIFPKCPLFPHCLRYCTLVGNSPY